MEGPSPEAIIANLIRIIERRENVKIDYWVRETRDADPDNRESKNQSRRIKT